MKRWVAWVLFGGLVVGTANSADAADAEKPAADLRLLWPDGAPGAKGDGAEDKPTLQVYLPPKDKATGTAVVICPGGGYGALAMDHEGRQVAQWFNSIGVAGFVLRYRLGQQYQHPAPLQDAQRAIRWVRTHADEFGVSPDRVGIMGFSAGGHLASTAGTHFDAGDSGAADSIDRASCRPDFLILGYPVISFVSPFTHAGSRRNLLGASPTQEQLENLSNERQVTPNTPPTFMFHTTEDRGVPPQNSVVFYLALCSAGVPAELHIYQKGPHGVGLAPGDPILSTWSDRLADWMRTNGWLSDAPRAAVSGEVKVNGKPVGRGWITFLPEKKGDPSAAAGIRDGKYALAEAEGPAVGKCSVEIRVTGEAIKPEPTIDGARTVTVENAQDKSALQCEIKAGKNAFNVDVKSP